MTDSIWRAACFNLIFLSLALIGASPSDPYDLIITHASLFDVHSRTVSPNKTITVKHGRVVSILTDGESGDLSAGQTIDAKGRLVTPGFLDIHAHVTEILDDSISSGGGKLQNLSMRPDSIAQYRKRLADAYLPYGITTVRDVGAPEAYMPMLLAWMKSDQSAPDFYPVGGSIVSHEEGRVPFAEHVEVKDSADSAAKVEQYYRLGIRHIKLYWRLRPKEYDSAYRKATELGMNVCTHVDYKVNTINHALDIGVREFEHMHTLGVEALSQSQIDSLYHLFLLTFDGKTKAGFLMWAMNMFTGIGKDNGRMDSIIERFRETHSSLTTTIHMFAHPFGSTYYKPKPRGDWDDPSQLTEEDIRRGRAGFEVMGFYVKKMFDEGIQLNLGSDVPDLGKACLSEMLVLNGLGIPMNEVINIATINSAKAAGLDGDSGAIDPGKKANLIIFENSPLKDPKNLLSGKIVIKDGVVWNPVQENSR
jgi:imidazolonepropionase-like amidohydrolase